MWRRFLLILTFRFLAWLIAWPILGVRLAFRLVFGLLRILLDRRDRRLSFLWVMLLGGLILLLVSGS